MLPLEDLIERLIKLGVKVEFISGLEGNVHCTLRCEGIKSYCGDSVKSSFLNALRMLPKEISSKILGELK